MGGGRRWRDGTRSPSRRQRAACAESPLWKRRPWDPGPLRIRALETDEPRRPLSQPSALPPQQESRHRPRDGPRVLGREEGDVAVAPRSGQMEGHGPGGVAGGEGAEDTGVGYAVGSEAESWGRRCQKVGDGLQFQSLIPGEEVVYGEKPIF